MKLDFFKRLLTNEFTKSIINELRVLNTKNGFQSEIEELLKPLSNEKHYNGENLTENEKIEITIDTIKSVALHEQKTNKTVKTLKKVFHYSNKKMIPSLINYVINSIDLNKPQHKNGTAMFVHI